VSCWLCLKDAESVAVVKNVGRALSRGYFSKPTCERACSSNVSYWLALPARAKRSGGSSSLRHDSAQINDESITSTQTSMQCCSTLCVRSWKTSLRSVSSTGTRCQCGWITFHVRRYMPSIALHQPSRLPPAREFLNASGHTLRRVRLLLGSSKDSKDLKRFGIAHGTMDIVIDDGDHSPAGQERTLLTLWPIVKPGGYYIIEDMATGANRHSGLYDGKLEKSGSVPMVHNPSAAAYSILSNNHAIFVDTAVGHPSFRKWADSLRRPANQYQFAPIDTTNVVDHNSHLLVLRKRLHRGVHISPWKKGSLR